MSLSVSEALLQPADVLPIQIGNLPRSSTLRVLVLPDLHLPAAPAQEQMLLANRAFLDQHDWVILLGDMTCCYGTVGEYDHVRRFISRLNRPYSVVNGNHEFHFLPADEGSSEYGHRFVPGNPMVRRELFQRFEKFYGLSTRFEAGSANGVGFCLVGVDEIDGCDQGLLDTAHSAWLSETIERFGDRPIVFFSHFPLCDDRLNSIRYYQQGRKPYLKPSEQIQRQLAARTQPTFWFSGHVHFRTEHPLSKPYLTDHGVWQVHCPDARGYGRANNDEWQPQKYDGLFARSFTIDGDRSIRRLTLVTTDLQRMQVVSTQEFLLPASAKAPIAAMQSRAVLAAQ